jgi:hypothetical protein
MVAAFAIGWPIAAGTAYLAIPFARSLTQRIAAAIEGAVVSCGACTTRKE